MTDSTPTSAPAGWFPAGVQGQERYWDGTSWTDQVRPAGGIATATGVVPGPPTAPAPEKRPRNILGIVALAVAAVGFIFACIPGALIVGWILLPIGFFLGIIALFQKDKPKWQGLTAIIVSVVGTIVGVIVFMAVAAGAVSDAINATVTEEVGTSDVADEETSADEEPAVEEEPAVADAEDLVLGETAFGVDTESGMGWYAVQVTNPNEDYIFASAGIDVEAYDANGVLIDTDSTYGTILSGTSWYVGDFFDIGSAQINHIEVRGPTADAATHSPAAETGSFTMGPITTGSEYDYMTVNGTVTSNFSEDQDMVRIDLIARDGGGKIVGVDFTYTDRVPSGGTAAWNVDFWKVPLDSKVEAHPHL
ncbi:DUF2510 domain-containing protein [Microbacterium atlanticum]|uniref:DUF2510 domain-containing protein n=1 Tax=Microbacterium atlanticum TaxID=2782168 RepID=UPI001E504606|nr:DUF2510 domain-containing protein [Microbacterium atlanticum]